MIRLYCEWVFDFPRPRSDFQRLVSPRPLVSLIVTLVVLVSENKVILVSFLVSKHKITSIVGKAAIGAGTVFSTRLSIVAGSIICSPTVILSLRSAPAAFVRLSAGRCLFIVCVTF